MVLLHLLSVLGSELRDSGASQPRTAEKGWTDLRRDLRRVVLEGLEDAFVFECCKHVRVASEVYDGSAAANTKETRVLRCCPSAAPGVPGSIWQIAVFFGAVT